MYDSTATVTRIKELCKERNITIKELLEFCQLGKNTISHMSSGRIIASDSISKIADHLGCSVDYLLGRTGAVNVSEGVDLSTEETRVVAKYRALSENGKAIVDKYLEDLFTNEAIKNTPTTFSDERIDAILQNRPELTELAAQIRTLNRDQTLKAIDYIQFLHSQQDKS